MSLLRALMHQNDEIQVRPPDFAEQRGDLVLQVWGDEGYWHIVDSEFRDFLTFLEHPVSLSYVIRTHPQWRAHKRVIHDLVARIQNAGLRVGEPKHKPSPKIENVTINLVTGCNLNCHTCYISQDLRSTERLNISQAVKFLEDLRSHMGLQATLSLLGGEPFLHLDGIIQIGLWAKKYNISCNVSTNGTILSENLVRNLSEAGLRVQVSLDGATPSVNDQIRGVGSFQKAIFTVERLVRQGIYTCMCMTCCRQNVFQISDYFRLAQNLGVKEVRFIPLKKLGNALSGSIDPAPQLDIVTAICRELDRAPELRMFCRSDIYSIVRSMLLESSTRRTCGSGIETLLIQPDGSVFPCINTTTPKLKLGHVNDGAAFVLERGRQFGNNLSIDAHDHPCQACHVKRWCLAGCPGETIQRSGYLNCTHWNCDDLKSTITFVMWKIASEPQI